MILYEDGENRVKDVNTTQDASLIPLYVDENNETFPFTGWSVAKICCYKVTAVNGVVTMYTPYVDSNLIDHIDQLGKQAEAAMPYTATQELSCGDTEAWFADVPDGNLTVSIKDSEGNYPECSVVREDDVIKVVFDPLEYAADITITIQ